MSVDSQNQSELGGGAGEIPGDPTNAANRVTRTSQVEQDSGSEHESEPEPQDEANSELEPWADWIKRVTHSAEESLEKLKIKTWVEQARRRKWR